MNEEQNKTSVSLEAWIHSRIEDKYNKYARKDMEWSRIAAREIAVEIKEGLGL